jgi:tripartite-type tricarboxylate transporter receptor subunit TctC
MPFVMLVNPSVPAATVAEFIAYAKANPGKVIMASDGNGTVSHVAGELFRMMAGVDLLHVPYRSGPPALTDLIGGQVQVMFEPLASSIGFVRAGKLRALAVASAMRSELLPEVPTVGDFVPGYEATASFGLGAPRNTPGEIVGRLSKEVNIAVTDARIVARLADLAGSPMPMAPAEYGRLIAEESAKWGKVIKFAGIKPEGTGP